MRDFSAERKSLQRKGLVPKWMTTGGWQLFSQKYLSGGATNVKEQLDRISSTLAVHAPKNFPDWWETNKYTKGKTWEQVFFNIVWDGYYSLSTPIWCNTGTDLGMPVSCSGSYVPNSVFGFYDTRKTTAVLTKNGFGTAAYLGDIQPRGSICKTGKASGALPVFKMFVQDSIDITQGTRRGAWAGYLPIMHGDFHEVSKWLEDAPDGANVGWCIDDAYKVALDSKDPEARKRWNRMLYVKSNFGKGYEQYTDKINRQRPQMMIDHGLLVKSSQLCTEIVEYSDEEHDYTCVLGSLIDANYRNWCDKLAFIGTVLLDCVASEFLHKAKNIRGLEKAVRYTEKARSLGMGRMGWHTLLQKESIIFGSLESFYLNGEISKLIEKDSLEATQWLAKELGEPFWCKGYGVRNMHRTAIAPTKSTSLLAGGLSEGINPDPAMTYTQSTPAGEVQRINPVLLEIMKERGVYTSEIVAELVNKKGSVQGDWVTWLTQHEKDVFKTGYEIDPYAHLNLCAQRQKNVCQAQSINLFIGGTVTGKYISELHKYALDNEDILTLYYQYGLRDASVSQECMACQ